MTRQADAAPQGRSRGGGPTLNERQERGADPKMAVSHRIDKIYALADEVFRQRAADVRGKEHQRSGCLRGMPRFPAADDRINRRVGGGRSFDFQVEVVGGLRRLNGDNPIDSLSRLGSLVKADFNLLDEGKAA